MLRPKDDAVFSGAKLKFIVLDEAHIYKGATGMETSLLMRRLRARISEPDSVQYILTSATLGGPDADGDILSFAEKLCGVAFQRSGIIRSTEKRPAMEDFLDFAPALFEELQRSPDISSVLARYHADFAPGGSEGEKLYALFLHSRLFALLRKVAHQPVTVAQLRQALSEICPMTNEQVISFIAVCARAEKRWRKSDQTPLSLFCASLEGGIYHARFSKHLFYIRKHSFTSGNNKTDAAVFEAAVCTDCGRIAIVGREEGGALRPSARKGLDDPSDFYYLKDSAEDVLIDEEDCADDATNDFVICAVCGAISTEADTKFKPLCEHSESNYRKLRKIEQLTKTMLPDALPAALVRSATSIWEAKQPPLYWEPSFSSNFPTRKSP